MALGDMFSGVPLSQGQTLPPAMAQPPTDLSEMLMLVAGAMAPTYVLRPNAYKEWTRPTGAGDVRANMLPVGNTFGAGVHTDPAYKFRLLFGAPGNTNNSTWTGGLR